MKQLLIAFLLTFFIYAWTSNGVIVAWENMPQTGTPTVRCTFTDANNTSHYVVMNLNFWETYQGTTYFRRLYDFTGPPWFADCKGYIDGEEVTSALGFDWFPYKMFFPTSLKG